MNFQRYIVVGDVHGCIEELDDLLAALQYRGRNSGDRLVFVGDLLDRGPDPVGVVRRVRELQAESVLGNHEEKHLRWRRWEDRIAAGEVDKNPMRPFSEERLAQHNALTAEDMGWLRSLPASLRLDARWLVVHAGFECDGTPPEEQKLSRICRVRDVDSSGKMAVNKENLFEPAPGSKPWGMAWTGPENVVYGHAVHDRKGIFVSKHKPGTPEACATYGIDTGCVFGGHLTALVIDPSGTEPPEIEQAPARDTYFKAPAGWRPGRPMSSLT